MAAPVNKKQATSKTSTSSLSRTDTTAAPVPLTTPYIQPDICTDPGYLGSSVSASGQSSGNGFVIHRSLALGCFPPFYLSASGTYSPGMCPSGHKTVRSSVVGAVTSAHCCPTGGWVAQDDGCIKAVTNKPQLVQSFAISGKKFTATTLRDYTILTYAVHVLYKESDLSAFPSGYIPGSVFPGVDATTTDSTSTSSNTNSPGQGSKPSDTTGPTNSKGLGTGSVVAIVLCTIALVLGIALGMFFLLRRRRQKRVANSAAHTGLESTHSSISKHHIEMESPPTTIPEVIAEPQPPVEIHELDGTHINELPDSTVRRNLPFSNQVEPKSLSMDLLLPAASRSKRSLSNSGQS